MNGSERLDLTRRRGVGDLLGDSLTVYFRNFATVFAIAFPIVAVVQLIVSGIGLEQLTSGYQEEATTAETLIPTAVSYLVVAPLIAAATIDVIQRLSTGERPHAGRAIQAGLDIFVPVFVAVVLAGIGIGIGLVALIVPGLYLAVRWLFVPQSVVIDGARGGEALRGSWRTTGGYWWRTFAVVVLANVIAFLPATLLVLPLQTLAEEADRQAIALAGMILTESLTAPFVAIVATLLFFDIRVRRAARPPDGGASGGAGEEAGEPGGPADEPADPDGHPTSADVAEPGDPTRPA